MLGTMPDEMAWSKRLRGLLALWLLVSALAGPLLIGFRFLSSRGSLPEAPSGAGVLTILVNACMLTALLLMAGVLVSLLFTGVATRDDRPWKTVGKSIGFGLLGLLLLFSNDSSLRIGGWLVLIAVFCAVVAPLSRWIETHFIEVSAAIALAMIAGMLFMPNWMRDWWTSGGGAEYRLKPLSELNPAEWGTAVLGAVVYVMAYGAFQQWRTKGKWLDDVKKKLGGET